MIDTLRLGIPLGKAQHKRLLEAAAKGDRWQSAKLHLQTGELAIRRVQSLASTDCHSYHRELLWDVPPHWTDGALMVVEFSIPKFWYGHNIRLLYNWLGALREFKALLDRQFRSRFAKPEAWILLRVDCCYAWLCPSQHIAKQLMHRLQRFSFPGKRPIRHDESILFVGRTYSFKFYLKLPEFQYHDKPQLLKQGALVEWVDYLESLAVGVLRCEATLRFQYLNTPKQYIESRRLSTVSDLLEPLSDGRKVTVTILTYLITKLLGAQKMLDTSVTVKDKLLAFYPTSKAVTLLGFWLQVQQFGIGEVKEMLTKPTFYRYRSDLKAAGISLVAPPSGEDSDFLDRFSFSVPSPYAVNRFDDRRNSESLLNWGDRESTGPDSSVAL